MPIPWRPVEFKRRETRLRKNLGDILPNETATVVIRAALVSDESGSAFQPKGACYFLWVQGGVLFPLGYTPSYTVETQHRRFLFSYFFGKLLF